MPLMAFIAVILIFSLYYDSIKAKQVVLELNEAHNVEMQRDVMAKDFKSVLSDLTILAGYLEFNGIFDGEDTAGAKKHLSDNFVLFSSRKRTYDQIRYIDETGKEVVRVNFNNGNPEIVPDDQLQDKANHYYFEETFALAHGEFFVSPFDLNIEGQQVEISIKPVIRFGSPVFDKSEKKRGVVIINYLGDKLLKELAQSSQNSLGQSMLLTPDGYWIYSPNAEGQWGFMFTDKENLVFRKSYPEASEKIFSEESGQFQTSNGLFTYETVYLSADHEKNGGKTAKSNNPFIHRVKTREYWKVVSYITTKAYNGATQKNINIFLLAFIFLAGLLIVISLGAARSMVTSMVAEAENKKLATFVKQTAESVIVTDHEGIIEYVNPAFEKITGFSSTEAVGNKANILKSGKHDEIFYRRMWDTIKKGKVWFGHITNKKKNGELFEEEMIITPLMDSSGIPMTYIATQRDVTSEMKLESQLRQSQKMQAIGTLAGGIAHDFNNILAAVIGYTEMSLEDIPVGSEVHDNLTEAMKASIRAKELVRQILAFSRHGEQAMRPISLHIIVKEAMKLLRATLPSTLNIQLTTEGDSLAVMADSIQITQVIMNLCVNAGHSMEGQVGWLSVSLKPFYINNEFAISCENLKAGNYMKLSVSDTGHGIDKETVERIFEPFFTTKEVGEGTGLGLAMVHGIVTSHGGAVTVHSEPGKGSTFTVYLPMIEGAEYVEEKMVEPIETGNERILFIDDEDQLVHMGKQMLNRLGYDVVARTSPIEAFETFRAYPDKFDLVITDHTMPEMTGAQLTEKILEIRPDLPVILLTGFSQNITPAKAKAIGIKEFVTKPTVIRDLAASIRRALDN